MIRRRHGKTPYELLHDKPPDLSYLHVFGALCYPTNDSENLGKLQPKADIGIFIGYAPTKKAFRIYNRRLVPNPPSSTPFVPPSRSDWDLLFQPMFDESLNPPPYVDLQAPEVIAPILEAVAPEHAVSTGSPSSTTVDQDAPSPNMQEELYEFERLEVCMCQGKVFKSEVELQLGKKIKALRSDRGGEYLSQEFKDYLGKNGIVQHLTSPYTPQQNGVSERRNRTLLDMVRSMFNLTTLPLSFWDYALESAVRILNMVPTKKVDKTPYEIWHGKVPNLSYLKVWGCEAYVKRDSADKLQQRSVKCIFVGYPKETMGYYFYFPPENKVIVARYGDFLERDLISQEFSGRDYDLEDDHMDTLPSENTSEIPVEPESLGPPPELIPVRRSERTTRAPNRLCLNMEVEDDVVGDLGEPANYKAAMLDPDKVIWQGAMDEEMNSMKVNEVWIEVDPPPNAKIVRSKWLFKKKTDMDGEVHTYKARLVAVGFTQTYGIDYEETFSPVADIRAIRILIAIAAYYDYEIWQMDVKTAFLNGRLDEDIYMVQPEGSTGRVIATDSVIVATSGYVVPAAYDISPGRVNSNAKFPYLKKEEYETWAMKMEYWIMNTDHNLWNIVLLGNSRKRTDRDPRGNIMILPPVTMEEQIAVQ
ncbi:retrotransposon protein, putative, ty1-copia subclass [Tanacetum coccineum]